jgi:hypothetical protein
MIVWSDVDEQQDVNALDESSSQEGDRPRAAGKLTLIAPRSPW